MKLNNCVPLLHPGIENMSKRAEKNHLLYKPAFNHIIKAMDVFLYSWFSGTVDLQ
jgi:hypothetical protein